MVSLRIGDIKHLINLFKETGAVISDADVNHITGVVDSVYFGGYNNGVNIEMGSGQPTEFDREAQAQELLSGLSFDGSSIDVATELDRIWSVGTVDGGWDS